MNVFVFNVIQCVIQNDNATKSSTENVCNTDGHFDLIVHFGNPPTLGHDNMAHFVWAI